jgi:WD40 repeat protein
MTGNARGAIMQILHGHTNIVPFLTFSPDGMRAAASSKKGTIIVWDID